MNLPPSRTGVRQRPRQTNLINDSPEFLLLESACPRPGALFLSSGLLCALLVLAAIPARPMRASSPPRPESVSDAALPCGMLWLPASSTGPKLRRGAPPHSQVDSAERDPHLKLVESETARAAVLAGTPPLERSTLPQLSMRVDEGWLEALPQTKEELYFSVATPQEDSDVLAYLPATHGLTLKRPLQPLWQIREGERVPALAALRSDAARQLGVSAELVGLYIWHAPVLEERPAHVRPGANGGPRRAYGCTRSGHRALRVCPRRLPHDL